MSTADPPRRKRAAPRKDVGGEQSSLPIVRARVDVDCKLTRSFVVDVPAITEKPRELHSIAEHVVREVIEERPDVWDRAAWRWMPETGSPPPTEFPTRM